MADVKELLQSGYILAGQSGTSTPKATKFSDVLRDRLVKMGSPPPADASDERLQWFTGEASLRLLVKLRHSFNALPPSLEPVFGSRDIKVLAFLASLAARWALAPLLDPAVLPDDFKEPAKERITEVAPGDLGHIVSDFTKCLNLELLGPPDIQSDELLGHVLPHLLPVYLPALLQLRHSGSQEADRVAAALLNFLSPYVAMSMLLILTRPSAAPWLVAEASQRLSAQVMRHQGVFCLLKILCPDVDGSLSQVQMDIVLKLLTTPARNVTPEEHYGHTLPALFTLIEWAGSDGQQMPVPAALVRCAAYVFSRLLVKGVPQAAPQILELFRSSFTLYTSSSEGEESLDDTVLDPVRLHKGLETLLVYFNNMPPSSGLVNEVLLPELPLLLSLYMFTFPSQPEIQRSLFKKSEAAATDIKMLLAIWLKTTPLQPLVLALQKTLSSLLQPESTAIPENAHWAVAENGLPCLRQSDTPDADKPPWFEIDQLSFLELLKAEATQELRAALLVRWIGELEGSQPGSPESKALKIQLLMQALGSWGPDTLQDPSQSLAFVAFTLSEPLADPAAEDPARRLGDLNLQDEDDDEGHDQLHATGLTLLLALLEGHPEINQSNHPILRIIKSRVEPLAEQETGLSELAREAKTVLKLRESALSAAAPKPNDPSAASRQLYQESLRLLEDPILPVKAQGLAQLRSLIGQPNTDESLYPGILDAYIQFVDNDDSFLYLAAVQGLAELALYEPPTEGRRVAERLMGIYAGKEKAFSERKLDRKLRVGEAVASLVQCTASAVAIYVDIIVPRLLDLLQDTKSQTLLRVSALTILATCAEASPLALLPYSETVLDACLTLLSLESRPSPLEAPKPEESDDSDDDTETEALPESQSAKKAKPKRPEETPDALTTITTHPSLRRGALLFLAVQARAQQHFNETRNTSTSFFPFKMLVRAKSVVQYVEDVDADELVRFQASEALEEIVALLAHV